jgi:hypothetical protein
VDDCPIEIGSMLLTLVDPNRGHEVAYNRWYERDHFYAGCMVGPWLFAGSRWVATRGLKDLRISDGRGEVASPVDAGSYVAIYWVHAGKDEEHWKWAGEQVHWLYSNGRGFPDRTHVHTAPFDYLTTTYRDADPVPIQLALDHGYPAIAMIATDRSEGVSEEEFAAWTAESAGLEGGPIASISTWRPQPRNEITGNAPMDLGTSPGGPARAMQLAFLEGDTKQAWESVRRYAAAIEDSGKGRVCFAGPFYKTEVGTDTYADQLW